MTTPIQPRASLTRSLRRAIGLLRLLASHTRIGWRLSDLADQTGLDRATVHRLLTSLSDEGLVTRVPGTRHYTLGALAFELGLAAAPYFDIGQMQQDRLAALAHDLHGSMFLTIRSGVESVCLARQDGRRTDHALMLQVGGRRPLCLTAGGVAMLIHLTQAEQKQVEADNRRTISRLHAGRWTGVRSMLKRSRPLGFALNLGDIAPGICALGVPLRDRAGQPVASLTLALTGSSLSAPDALPLARRLALEADAMAPMLAQLRY